MRLHTEIFYDKNDDCAEEQLTDFVNINRIEKADIQSIIYERKADCLVLFYWSK